MVSFVCDSCQTTLKKQKLDQHASRCQYAQFSCVDCMKTFSGTEYRAHTSCISEAEKYQKALYKPPKKGQQQQKQENQEQKNASASNSNVNANIARPAVGDSLIGQIQKADQSKKREREDDEAATNTEKSVPKKSKKEETEDGDENTTNGSSIGTDELIEVLRSVLKKSGSLTLHTLRKRSIKRIVKRFSLEEANAETAFDRQIVFKLEDGKITISQ
ncbi:LYAR-type C2HC zinc finger-domain-containing protein [Cladochytrium replicatum]|nr:LYAR-type C2HC zinc finger-domain-containing protein [Cladochytrium replicatum]